MIEYISPSRIANEILQGKTYNGIYVFVEGIKDWKLYSKFFNSEVAKVKPTFGSKNLLEVFEILNNRGFQDKIGILDKDFLDIYASIPNIDNIFFSDCHDLEVMMISSKAFDNVLRIFVTTDKIEDFEKKVNKKIRDLIFSISDNIGYLKLIEKKYSFGLKFKPDKPEGNQLKYSDFISEKMEYLGDDKLIKTVINYSRSKTDKTLNEKEIKGKFLEEKKNKYSSQQLSNGHDLSNLIFIFLKKTVRSKNNMLSDFNSIEDSLVLAYELEDFKKTILYNNLLNWSQKNETNLFKTF